MAHLNWENLYYRLDNENLIEATEAAIGLLQKRAKKEKNPLFSVFAKHLSRLVVELKEKPNRMSPLSPWPDIVNLLEKLFPAPDLRFRQDLTQFFKGYSHD